jgi:hypothetical protein
LRRSFFSECAGGLLLRSVHAGGGEGGHAFATAEEAHGFVGGGFDADAGGGSPSGWGISTPLANGKRNPAASIMLSLLAEMARNEVEVLRERINSGLAQARREGVVLGRHKGSTISNDEFLSKHADIVRLLKQGQTIRHAGKITGKGFSTVQSGKKILDQQQVLLAA